MNLLIVVVFLLSVSNFHAHSMMRIDTTLQECHMTISKIPLNLHLSIDSLEYEDSIFEVTLISDSSLSLEHWLSSYSMSVFLFFAFISWYLFSLSISMTSYFLSNLYCFFLQHILRHMPIAKQRIRLFFFSRRFSSFFLSYRICSLLLYQVKCTYAFLKRNFTALNVPLMRMIRWMVIHAEKMRT